MRAFLITAIEHVESFRRLVISLPGLWANRIRTKRDSIRLQHLIALHEDQLTLALQHNDVTCYFRFLRFRSAFLCPARCFGVARPPGLVSPPFAASFARPICRMTFAQAAFDDSVPGPDSHPHHLFRSLVALTSGGMIALHYLLQVVANEGNGLPPILWSGKRRLSLWAGVGAAEWKTAQALCHRQPDCGIGLADIGPWMFRVIAWTT